MLLLLCDRICRLCDVHGVGLLRACRKEQICERPIGIDVLSRGGDGKLPGNAVDGTRTASVIANRSCVLYDLDLDGIADASIVHEASRAYWMYT